MGYSAGGGRTLRANAIKRSFSETGTASTMKTGVNAALCRCAVALGAAVWAVMQTVQVADSVPLE